MAVGAVRAGQLVAVGYKRLEIAFEVRICRAKRRLSNLAESIWTSLELR